MQRAVGRTVRSYVVARWWSLRALLRIPKHRDIHLADSVGAPDALGRLTEHSPVTRKFGEAVDRRPQYVGSNIPVPGVSYRWAASTSQTSSCRMALTMSKGA